MLEINHFREKINVILTKLFLHSPKTEYGKGKVSLHSGIDFRTKELSEKGF